jgi:predicted RND superfamily exporter protein
MMGMARLRVDADIREVFGDHSRIVRWLRFTEAHLSSGGALEIEITSPTPLLADEDMRRAVSRIVDSVSSIEGISTARCVLDLTSQVRQVLRDEDPDSTGRADQEPSDSELLFLLSLAEASLLDPWMSLDGRRIRISAEAKQSSALDSGRILEEVERRVAATLPIRASYTITGAFAVQYDMLTQVQALQLRSFFTAWSVVLILLAVFLRSIWLALLGMFPTTLPVTLTLGVMGFWGINLDIGTAMVGAVVLGIAVDDTIHLLARFRRERSEGATRGDAIHEAVVHVGRPVITTSAALVVGFLAMTVSSWESVASFGLLSAIAILGALVADLVLLPALVMGFGASHRAPTARELSDGR